MPISRRNINRGDYVLYRHQNSGRIIATRIDQDRSEVEVGDYLGYRSLEDAAAAARRDARERHAQNYQIYWENIGGLHVFTRNSRGSSGRKRSMLSTDQVIAELDKISRDNPDIPNLRGSLARVPESRYYRPPPAGSFSASSGGDRPDDDELHAWLFKARQEARKRGDPRFAPTAQEYRPSGAELAGSKLPPYTDPGFVGRPITRNPGGPPAPRPPRPGRSVRRRDQPAAVLPRLRRMIDEEERGAFDPARSYPRETKPHHFAVNPISVADVPDDYAFVLGAARAFFVPAWANAAEEAGYEFAGGTRLEEVAPETPDELIGGAERFIASVEKLNGKPIAELFVEAVNTEGSHEREPDPEDFGFSLAMEAMGHGVSWYDDHPVPEAGEFSLPSVESIVSVAEDDIDDASVDYFEISERFAEPRRPG